MRNGCKSKSGTQEMLMAQKITRGYREMLAEANAAVTALSARQAMDMLNQSNVVFVDVRDPRELEREGAIPGALHCPRGLLEFWVDPASPYAKPIFQEDRTFVFFCALGWRSVLAAKTVQDMGLTPVAHIAGGFAAWKSEGGAVIDIRAKAGQRP
jgi:rhodanese-related sulfurtransferase